MHFEKKIHQDILQGLSFQSTHDALCLLSLWHDLLGNVFSHICKSGPKSLSCVILTGKLFSACVQGSCLHLVWLLLQLNECPLRPQYNFMPALLSHYQSLSLTLLLPQVIEIWDIFITLGADRNSSLKQIQQTSYSPSTVYFRPIPTDHLQQCSIVFGS